MPYYTLEIEPDGTVRQKRTKFDRQEPDIKDAKKFLAEWQRVVAKRLTRGDRKRRRPAGYSESRSLTRCAGIM